MPNVNRSIQEYLGVPSDWKVKENVKFAINIMPNANDVKSARKKDPRGCALHNAACRMFDVPNAAIGGRWAYIPQRTPSGKHYIARMQATQATQRAIREFDETGKMPEGGFHFRPLAKTHTKKYKAAYNKMWQIAIKNKGLNKPKGPMKKRHRIVTRTLPYGVK